MNLEVFTRDNIEPSRETKHALQPARNNDTLHGSVNHPGMFQQSGFGTDSIMTLSGAAVDLFSIAQLTLLIQVNWLVALGVLAIEVLLAWMAHCGTGARHIARARGLVEADEARRAQVSSTPLWHGLVRFLAATGIIGFTVLKSLTLVFLGLPTGMPVGVVCTFVVLYGFCAYVHLRHTGFFLAGLSARIRLFRDYRRALRQRDDQLNPFLVREHRRVQFHSPVPLDLPIRIGRHEVVCTDTAKGFYEMRIWGLLLDTQLANMINGQSGMMQKHVLALAGLAAQLQCLDTQPISPSASSSNPVASTPGVLPSPQAAAISPASVFPAAACLLLALTLSSCGPQARRGQATTAFPLHILGAGPLHTRGSSQLPADLASLAAPAEAYPGDALPQLYLQRADLPAVRPQPVELPPPAPTSMQSFFGAPTSVKQHLDFRAASVAKGISIPEALLASAAALPPEALRNHLHAQLSRHKGLVLAYDPDERIQGTLTLGERTLPVITDVKELSRQMRQWLQQHPGGSVALFTGLEALLPPAAPLITEAESTADDASGPETEPPAAPQTAVTVRLHLPEGLGRRLLPQLPLAFLSTDESGRKHTEPLASGGLAVEGTLGGQQLRLEFATGSDLAGIQALSEGRADCLVLCRELTAVELAALRGVADFSQLEHEFFAGMEPVALITGHASQVPPTMSFADLRSIFCQPGRSPWHPLMPPAALGLDDLLTDRVGAAPGPQVTRLGTEAEIVREVTRDPKAIGLVSLAVVSEHVRSIAIARDAGIPAVLPSAHAIGTEFYALARRIRLFVAPETPAAPARDIARRFAEFVSNSRQARAVLTQAGLQPEGIRFDSATPFAVKPAVPPPPASPLPEYNQLTAGTLPLPFAIRFEPNSSEFDNHSLSILRDLARVLREDPRARSCQIIVIGFADDRNYTNDPEHNLKLSRLRAQRVAEELRARHGIRVHLVTGFGEQLPFASNATEEGRSLNRRVELFLRPAEGMVSQP